MINPINTITTKYNKIEYKKEDSTNQELPRNILELADYKTGQAILARNNISFRSSAELTSIENIPMEVIVNNNIKYPQISIDLNLKEDIATPKGLFAIYAFAMNDQMYEIINNNPRLKESGSYILPQKRKLHLECTDNLENTLQIMGKHFLNTEIDTKHFRNAKELSPVAFFLYQKNNDYKELFSDISKEISENEYCKIVDKISYKDIEQYNKAFIEASDKKITILLNRSDYNNYKEFLTKYNKMEYKKEASTNQELLQKNFELADYKTGQAILARNNISFRNSAEPVEVTHLYNKKTEGKDHLDLPNVHVYEFPDTNLQVILDIANDIDFPYINIEFYNENLKDCSLIKNHLISQMLNLKMNQNFKNSNIFNETNIFTYHQYNNHNSLQNFEEVKKILFTPNFTDEELSYAKNNLINYFNSDDYNNRNLDLHFYYSPQKLFTQKETETIINSISLNDINDYYKIFLKNSSATINVVVDRNYSSNDILQNINQNIPIKFKKISNNTPLEDFVPNNKLTFVSTYNDSNPIDFNYKIQIQDDKEAIISDIVEFLVSRDKYLVSSNYYNDPINIKQAQDINTGNYYKINIHLDSQNEINPTKEFTDFYNYLKVLNNSNLENELNELKVLYKKKVLYNLTENQKSLDRFVSANSINLKFRAYELIDSINENDIKSFIQKFLIDQKPIIHINNANKNFNQGEILS